MIMLKRNILPINILVVRNCGNFLIGIFQAFAVVVSFGLLFC